MTVTASPCSFSKKNDSSMTLDQNPHHLVTRFGCVGFSRYLFGFSVPQMRQFCLFYIPEEITMGFIWKDDFFFAKIGIFCKAIAGPLLSVIQAYTQPYSPGGSIKIIISQIRHELSVTIHEWSTSWKKVGWRILYKRSR